MIPLPHAGVIFLYPSFHRWGSCACRYVVSLENKSPLEACFLLSMSSVVYMCRLGLTSILLFFLTIKSPSRVSSEVPPVLCLAVKPLILSSRTARVPGGRAIKQLINERLIQHRAEAWKSGKCCNVNPAVFVSSCSKELGTCGAGRCTGTAREPTASMGSMG